MTRRADAGDAGVAGKAKAAVTNVQEKAAEAIETVQEKAGDAIETARGKAGNLQATLADTLDERGLERPALWLRENDLTDVGALLWRQLRERPGRTALLALGIGFLLGRASRQ
jgi:hypothetical protein